MSPTNERSAAWVPILHLSHDAWLGLLGKTPFVGDLEGPKRQVDPDEPTGLLPCLERPYAVVVAELHDRESELSLSPGSLTRHVPLDAIPHAALVSRSNYWADLALAWLDEMPRTHSTMSTLENLGNADWAAQAVRHRARRIRREQS
jgi:hypothetical protein